VEWFRSVTLPAVALGIAVAAAFARHTRSAMQEVLRQDYIRAAVAKGATKRQVIVHHALRNSASPLVTVMAFQITALIGAAFVVERIFAMPGLGSLAIESIERNDPAPLLGLLLVVVFAVVIMNLLLDVAYAWLDPKVRTP
jgi:peptide/nickel transport system permease protein